MADNGAPVSNTQPSPHDPGNDGATLGGVAVDAATTIAAESAGVLGGVLSGVNSIVRSSAGVPLLLFVGGIAVASYTRRRR